MLCKDANRADANRTGANRTDANSRVQQAYGGATPDEAVNSGEYSYMAMTTCIL